MDMMALRRRVIETAERQSKIINLCPAATGTEIVEKFSITGGYRIYQLTGLDPDQAYTLQATWTKAWETEASKRLYLVGISSNTMVRPTTQDTAVPFTKTATNYPSADGTLSIRANNTGLTNATDGAEYAASMVNIMLEIGSDAHPYVPYIEQ